MYKALYRKYRPETFVNFVGQDEIKTTLINALSEKKTSHAYLFAGPRGTGKTSAAKLLAKAVNCENFKDDICNECDSCKLANKSIDIIEIDAASNNGVDEIRELRSKINLVPTELKYKVYIIDEVHMLTTGAFNALLKTLEEPPAHVMFILATTELYKVPITIVSRCQTFNFKRITETEIIERLKYIAKEEKLKLEDEVFEKIAQISNGGLRDAIGMLDKISSINTKKKITLEEFESINGLVNDNDIKLLIDLIVDNKDKQLLEELNCLYNDGKNISDLLNKMLHQLRGCLFEEHIYNNLDLKNKYIEIMKILNDVLQNSTEKNILLNFEVKILHFLKHQPVEKIKEVEKVVIKEKITEKIDKKEVVEEKEIISQEIIEIEKVEKSQNNRTYLFNELKEIRINNVFSKADKKYLTDVINKWKNLTTLDFNNNKDKKIAFLLDSKPVAASEDHLIIEFDYDSLSDKCLDHLDQIEDKLQKDYNINHKIIALSKTEWNEEKNKYIQNLNKKIVYKIKDDKETLNKIISLNKKVNLKEMDPLLTRVISVVGEDIVNIE